MVCDVPASEFAEWQKLGFTHIWLMGVWTTGPRARAEALQHSELRRHRAQLAGIALLGAMSLREDAALAARLARPVERREAGGEDLGKAVGVGYHRQTP